MRILPSGEAQTDHDCAICGRPHRLIGEDDRESLASAGFTAEELDAIDAQFRQQYGHDLATPGPTGGDGADPGMADELRRAKIREKVARFRARERERGR